MINSATTMPLRPCLANNGSVVSHQNITIEYRHLMDKEEIKIPIIPEIHTLSEQQKAQELATHLKSVLGIFLSETKVGQQDFVLHGSTALVINIINKSSVEAIHRAEIEGDILPEFYLPVLGNDQLDIDLVCSNIEINIEDIACFLRKSIEGFENKCKIEISSTVDLNTIIDNNDICQDRGKKIFLITGSITRIFALYEGKNILSLDITCPPTVKQPDALEFNRPYCKKSEKISVRFGNETVKINVSTLKQSLDDMRCGIDATKHYLKGRNNKFLSRMKTMAILSLRENLVLDGDDMFSIMLLSSEYKGQKFVSSSHQQTQTKEPNSTNERGVNTNVSSRRSRGSQVTTVCQKKTRGSMTEPRLQVSSYVQTDCSSLYDFDSSILEKAFADVAIQTIEHGSVDVPPRSVKPKTTSKKCCSCEECSTSLRPQSKRSEVRDNEEKKTRINKSVEEIKKIINRKMTFDIFARGKNCSGKEIKKLLNMNKLIELYKGLVNNFTLKECITILDRENFIEIFIASIGILIKEIFVNKGIDVAINLLEEGAMYEITSRFLSDCIALENMIGKAQEALISVDEEGNKQYKYKSLQGGAELQCSAFLKALYWINKVCEFKNGTMTGLNYIKQIEILVNAIILNYKKFLVVYASNSEFRKAEPHALFMLMVAIDIFSYVVVDDTFLTHLELCIVDKDYRMKNDDDELSKLLDVVESKIILLTEPVSYCSVLLRLSAISYEKGLYKMAAIIMVGHMGLMIKNQEYLQECHRIGYFKKQTTKNIEEIYFSLKERSNNGNDKSESGSACVSHIKSLLQQLSQRLKKVIMKESGILTVDLENSQERFV